MKSYANENLCSLQKRSPGPLEPAGKGRRMIQPIAMLEREDEGLGGVIIAKEGASPIEIAWARVTGAADCLPTRIDFERRPATSAERALDEGDPAPTVRA